ncbi:MAG: imelysin family protein [Anaerolineales bacterium]
MKTKFPFMILLSLFTSLVLASCGASAQDTLKQEFIENYANIVHASYEDSLKTALELQTAIEAFVAAPSEANLQAAKTAWLAAREPYGQTEAYRFYGGPIDDEDGPEGLLNAWPLDESYVDYVEGAPDAGIINNPADYPEITTALLESLNEQGAEENISVGYHAIEFLLWGQDLSEDGAGNRPYTDYTDAPNAERRAAYLSAAAGLLVTHLQEMVDAWAPNVEDNYRAQFLALDPDTALTHILTGMGVLSKSELAGERIFTAYDNQDQEDEHSCFSDNTHRDIITNAQGIYNIYFGAYTRTDGSVVSGTGLKDLLAAVDADLEAELTALFISTLETVNAIPAPFERAIVEADQRPLILEAVNALQSQGDKIAEAAAALGLTINTALPE